MRTFLIMSVVTVALAAPSSAQDSPLFAPSRDDPLAPLAGAFSCPFDLLADLYAALAPREIPGLMAVESEILLICAERQQLLQSLLDSEIALRDLAEFDSPQPSAARISIVDATLASALPEPAQCPPPPPPAVADEPVLAPPQASPGLPRPVPPRPAPQEEDQPPSPGAALIAAGLRALADAPAPTADVATTPTLPAHCGGDWHWEWTTRDPSGLRLARLLGADGQQVEVRETDVLPTGETVVNINPGGVVLRLGNERWPIPRATTNVHPDPAVTRPAPPPGTVPPDPAGLQPAAPALRDRLEALVGADPG